jgi:hypothetical protein
VRPFFKDRMPCYRHLSEEKETKLYRDDLSQGLGMPCGNYGIYLHLSTAGHIFLFVPVSGSGVLDNGRRRCLRMARRTVSFRMLSTFDSYAISL